MATYLATYNIQVTDVNGDTATMRVTEARADTALVSAIATQTAALAALVAAATNGKITSQGYTLEFVKAQISAGTAPPPASAIYPSVTDGARLEFNNSAGEKRVVVIPAPLLSDFKTNSNTVNPADTNMAALISFIEGITDLDGSTNLYQGGVKVAHHARKRATRKSL